jgi:sterol desaturase/sphingolipid hydroxylase (fatty acid hydroxylase superfamily)
MNLKDEQLGVLFYVVPVEAKYESMADVPDYFTRAIPWILALVVLEFFLGKWRKQDLYTAKDTIMSFCLSMFQNILSVFVHQFNTIPYIYVYNATAEFRSQYFPAWDSLMRNQEAPWLTFMIGMIGIDLGYYFMHKYAHEFHMLWASHSLHHCGERYNMATALRQGGTQQMYSMFFYLPLAALGFPVTHYVRHNRLNTLYQFWIHTEIIGRLPWWFELVMNTASHHRLHHRPPGNCNYGGVFIIFDRLGGTFQSECHLLPKKNDAIQSVPEDKDGDYVRGVVYGLAKSLNSYDCVYANFCHVHRLGQDDITGEFSVFRMLDRVLRTRVHQPIRFPRSWEEFMPDVLYDWQYLNRFSWWERPFIVFKRMFRGPPDVSELLEDKDLSQNKLQQNAFFTSRDKVFVQGRKLRESFDLSFGKTLLLLLHFFFSLSLSIYVMVKGKHLLETYGVTATVLLSVVAVLSLQMIKFHYK